MQDGIIPKLGSFHIEVYGSGRKGRRTSSRFTLRCDAIGLHHNEILLLSIVGPETSVKALTAGLRSSGKDQRRVEYSAQVGSLNRSALSKCPDGYRIYRAKLEYGLWHVLCLAKREGFMPVMTAEALWQHLQGDQFTTPLLREWTSWLTQKMKDRGAIVELTQNGCQAGLVVADDAKLDELVSAGIKEGHLAIGGQTAQSPAQQEPAIAKDIPDLDQYMLAYGAMLGKQAEQSLNPFHVPGRDPLRRLELLREPFDAQAHVSEAICKALHRQKALLLVGEMGTGKTIMAMAAVQAHAGTRPYRALVFCPGQLVNKWEREIRETIPGAEVIHIQSWRSLLYLARTRKPSQVQWYIIARDRAKLGAMWQPACRQLKHLDDGFLRCPSCGLRLVNEDREPLVLGKPAQDGRAGTGLWKRRARCEWVLSNHRGTGSSEQDDGDRLIEGCGSPLWQMNGKLRRY
jgi:hypothetical protein